LKNQTRFDFGDAVRLINQRYKGPSQKPEKTVSARQKGKQYADAAIHRPYRSIDFERARLNGTHRQYEPTERLELDAHKIKNLEERYKMMCKFKY